MMINYSISIHNRLAAQPVAVVQYAHVVQACPTEPMPEPSPGNKTKIEFYPLSEIVPDRDYGIIVYEWSECSDSQSAYKY